MVGEALVFNAFVVGDTEDFDVRQFRKHDLLLFRYHPNQKIGEEVGVVKGSGCGGINEWICCEIGEVVCESV